MSGAREERRRAAWKYRRRDRCRLSGKIRYPDSRAARDALRRYTESRNVAEDRGVANAHYEASTYLCDHCGGWHLTSRTKDESRGRAAWGARYGEPVAEIVLIPRRMPHTEHENR